MTLATLDAQELAHIRRRQCQRCSAHNILSAVADYFHVDVSDLTQPGPTHGVLSIPCGVAAYLLVTLLKWKHIQAGARMNRERSSISHAVFGIQRRLKYDAVLRRWIDEIVASAGGVKR